MSENGIRAQVSIFLPKSKKHPRISLGTGAGITVFHRGIYYPARMIECMPPIKGGENGVGVIDIVTFSDAGISLAPGDQIDLMAGPEDRVGVATVLELK
jgi:hypothetical protein